jgi:hypothetical protein
MPGVPDIAKPGSSFLVILISVLFGALAIVFLAWYPWGGLGMTVTEPKLVNGLVNDGTFRLHHRLFGFQSKGVGGACLIGDFAKLISNPNATAKGVFTGACTDRSQCNPKFTPADDKAGPTHPQQWEGYCVPDQSGQKRCWYKPWDDPNNEALLCEKSPLHGGAAWAVDKDYKVPLAPAGFDVSDFYNTYTADQPTQWRVSGRLFDTTLSKHIDVFSDPACMAPGKKQC